MAHGPATKWKEDKSEGFKTKLGLGMIAIFIVIYLTFILICVISPQTMANDIGGLNVAVTYGFLIIVIAIVQALIYNVICSRKEKADELSELEKGDDS
ncbi:MAG: DUF485 domain-containing protein [Dehalococcoidales bacterium]|nr:MAG: DUF485 domain-containing protein [Dehalococcoidales bacterium]